MNIKKIQVQKLKPAEYNPRKKLKPADEEYQKIKRSIQEFGFVDPLIVNKDMTIVGGHQRLSVLLDLGYDEIECVIVDLSKVKEKALNIALNKISGSWDMPLLENLLEELKTCGEIDETLTGFDLSEIDEFIQQEEIENLDDLLEELDLSNAVEKPIWVTIRAPQEMQKQIEEALNGLSGANLRIEKSYETMDEDAG